MFMYFAQNIVHFKIRKFKGYQRPPGSTPVAAKPPAKGVDLEAVGTINDVPVFEFDISSLDEKPWRKPGTNLAVKTET